MKIVMPTLGPRFHRNMEKPCRRAGARSFRLWAIVMGLLWLWSASPVTAATWEGVDVTVDTEWPGCGRGGYFPLRVNVVNRGQPRVMTFRTGGYSGDFPEVSKTVAVQTERITVCLLVPCVGPESYGALHVHVDGRKIPQLDHSLSLPARRDADVQGPAVLLVDTRDADWGEFKLALEGLLGMGASSGGSSGSYYPYSPTGTTGDDHKYVAPEALPTEWQAYSGLDIVVVSQGNLTRMSSGARGAIRRWVESGGTLLIIAAEGVDAAAGRKVDTLLASGNSSAEGWTSQPGSDGMRWGRRRQMLGSVMLMDDDPFKTLTSGQWQSVLSAIGRGRWEWSDRYGFSARHSTDDFMDFLIPSVKGVPVFAFLVLITLFAIVIGPVNYAVLWKKRRLYLLVVTIPLIAFVTSASLFGYSMIAHGFATRARVRSVTLVDQTSNTAVSASRVSLYSGLAPSDGLNFSRETAVFPIWGPGTGFGAGSLNWTESQHLDSGWLQSRTRTQFFVTTHRNERGRLEVTPEAATLSVSNGFEWDMESLIVADSSGKLFYGENISAGDGARLTPLTADQLAKFKSRINRDPLLRPASFASSSSGYSYSVYGWSYNAPTTSYQSNLAEQLISDLSRLSGTSFEDQPTHWYAAILASDPGIELGTETSDEESSLHVLRGSY